MHIELTDGSLLLRPPCVDDAPAIAAAVRESLIELHPWMGWATEAFDTAAARRWLETVQLGWEHASAFHFAITDAETGQYIGSCGIDDLNRRDGRCNLGYWVRISRTREGIASRATRLAARFAFEQLDLLRIEIMIASENTASQRTARKAGARYEGILRGGLVIRTDVHDALRYVLLPADLGLSPQ